MPVERGIVDANVLAYALNADTPQHASSRALLDAASDAATTLYVTSQILCEVYSLITNPRRVVVATPPEEALGIISSLLALPGIQVLPTTAAAVNEMIKLLGRRPVTGGDVFDLQIVATMLANGVDRIYTFNTGDFSPFEELKVVEP